MVPYRLHPDGARLGLAEEIRALGGVWLVCDERGTPLDINEIGQGDFLASLFLRSRPFHHVLRMLVPGMVASGGAMIGEPLPGLYAIASVLPGRTRPEAGIGIGIALVPTAAFAYGEDLFKLAASAGLDPQVLRSMILAADPPEPREIARLAPLVRFAHRADAERSTEIAATELVGAQLAETYEEINLLYTLVSGMTLSEEPMPFLGMACSELVRTLGFSWVALRLRPPLDRFAPPDGIVVAGEPGIDRERLRDLATRLLVASCVESPRVYPRGHRTLAMLGVEGPIVACPIRRDGRSNGVLLVGERRHHGLEVGSAELKLADATAGHLGLYLENASLYRDAEAMFLGTLEALVTAIDAKDPYTRGHSQRVAALARELARTVGVEEPSLRQIHIAGLIHDVGKIGVSESVLRKGGKLDEHEFAQIRMHPEIGWRILKDIPQFHGMLDAVLSHHERWDGRGYPQGLKGHDIPLIARIVALADSFDAMSSNRTYRSCRPRAQVFAEIRACAGSQFDPDLVGPFLGMDFAEYDRLHAEHELQPSMLQARDAA
jgi:HD-GYP domain-containing protein (c-di-GMP phosphodiesterase class II)